MNRTAARSVHLDVHMPNRRRLLAAASLLAVVALGAACGSKDSGGAIQTQSERAVTSTTAPQSDMYGYPSNDSSTTTAAGAGAAAAGDTITAKGFAFSGATVKAGATVKVVNQDGTAHTVTADDGSFDVRVDGNGTGSFTAPSKPGTYPFHCSIHPSMHGTLTVQ
ncbi:MAG TPA: cupredoxin domain-containing protein [Acidimicrobiales bacterium]|nr:cupredoxin domain-containing protein [Acidimicrobiales bacterium]